MTTANLTTHNQAVQMQLKALDALDIAYNCINDLTPLFKAIIQVSEKHSTEQGLASVGRYLSEDWANSIDIAREEIEKSEVMK